MNAFLKVSNTPSVLIALLTLALPSAAQPAAVPFPATGATTITWDLYDETTNGITGYQLEWQTAATGGIVNLPLGQLITVITVPREVPLPLCCHEIPPPVGCQCDDIRETHYWPLAVSPIAKVPAATTIPVGTEVTFHLRACTSFDAPGSCSGQSNGVTLLWPQVCDPGAPEFITCVSTP